MSSELWSHLEVEMEKMTPEGRLLAAMIKDLISELDEVKDSVQTIEHNAGKFEMIMRDHAAKTNELNERLGASFPSGDVDGHRRYHEEIIRRMEFRNQIIRDSLAKVASTGLIAGSMWLVYAAWHYFLGSLQK